MENKAVLDLSNLNIPISEEKSKYNGDSPARDPSSSKFVIKKTPKYVSGLLLRDLIYEKFRGLKDFAGKIGKTRTWAWYLIHEPEKVKMTKEKEKQISEILGIQIKFGGVQEK